MAEEQEQEQQQAVTETVAAENNCWYCHQAFQENDTKMELLCHHFLHTNCFMRNQYNNDGTRCGICDQRMNPFWLDFDTPDGTQNEHIAINNLYNTNQDFKKLVHTAAKQQRIVSAKERLYKKLVKEKKDSIRQQLLAIKAHLEGITSLKINEIKEDPIYKEMIKEKRRYELLLSSFHRDYNYGNRTVMAALKTKRGLKTWKPCYRYHFRRSSNLKSAFYFRIRV